MRWDDETLDRPALPLGELVQPLPLAALALLALNDHVLKGAGILPEWVTGKLSDFAGLFFFPLLLTAIVDTALALTRAPWDPTLRLWKAALACIATGAGFAATELSPAAAARYAALVTQLGIPSRSTADPTDLVALVMLPAAYAVARRHIRRVPYGRLAWALRRRASGTPVAETLADIAALNPTPARTALLQDLVAALEEHAATPATSTRVGSVQAATSTRVGSALSRLRS